MTTPIAERVAKPSHGRALSGDVSYLTIDQPRRGGPPRLYPGIGLAWTRAATTALPRAERLLS
jgi:hypothetical protein